MEYHAMHEHIFQLYLEDIETTLNLIRYKVKSGIYVDLESEFDELYEEIELLRTKNYASNIQLMILTSKIDTLRKELMK